MDTLKQWVRYRRPTTYGHNAPAGAKGQRLYWGWFAPRTAGAEIIGRPVRVGQTDWRVKYHSFIAYRPEYRVYCDGVLQMIDRTGRATIHAEVGQKVNVEILDDPDTAPAAAPPAVETVTWSSVSDAASYRLEELMTEEYGAGWVLRGAMQSTDAAAYQASTRPLADVTSHSYRVRPVGEDGNIGTEQRTNFTVARVPDVPTVSYTYSAATGNVTIAEVTE